ncbi:bacterio-opsin activator domain-containing protein [Natrinema salsiterrestre]|uniref:Helix-turn-helix domain-containing protein n=1 Tax=Natrinema salsiterrestre TaxID=2950540 RepID=A0A9Q4KWK3_9EURY|nr:bacterio-opsin activator domain-containing protein [Natrinema salsiterrestre]MDF9744188.1 helix-turn-helix domain-containing protein [Natrinema salsiterrestre]
MVSRNELTAATLDTLPITVAVLDDEGEILLTNRSWREFGSGTDDHVGADYIATTATADDEHARRAVTGIEAVLAGDRDSFTMEYPCHSPDQKRWFMMRASPFHEDGDRLVSLVHLDITERKLAEIAAEENARQVREEREALEHVLERVDGLVRNVTDAAVGAETREAIEREVCTCLAETDPYVLAWIGRADVTNQRLSPREWASQGTVPLEDDELIIGTDETHPAVRAFADGEAQVTRDLDAFEEADRWWPTGASEHFQSVAALPLTYGDITYGVLVVFASETDAFDERELLVLESLSETIATAMNALEVRRMLTTETVVSIEVAIEDPSLFVTGLSETLDTAISYRGLTYDADGTPLLFLHADREIDADSVEDTALDGSDVTILSETEDGAVLEVAAEDGLVTALSEHGGVIRELTVTDTVADLSVELPDGRSARSAYDLLEDRYDRVELVSYHETEEPAQTRQDVTSRLESSLTDRQLMAVRKAYYANYFEWPRDVSGEELAESMDISRSTFHQHLRTAQRKLLDEVLE